ncbi:MAG: hypothetical protein IJB65_05750 [Clostridia bacterium]|nr:hypothetical protein [Clostridia bacterium]
MTDKEIIKALELCIEGGDGSCTICPYANTPNCYDESGKDILDLIKRQRAEIERLLQKTQQPQIGTTKELKVIKLVETEYEKAKNLEYIRNPLAYALHKVWKMVDAEKGRWEE